MTAYSDLDATVAAYEEGAVEFIPKPFDIAAVVEQIRRSIDSNTLPAGSRGTKRASPSARGAGAARTSAHAAGAHATSNHAASTHTNTQARRTARTANVVGHALPDDRHGLIGEAPAMQRVYRAIGRLAKSRTTVLINGESGSGKELIAQALHRHSPRSDRPFVALNMAAIPHDLMESELFGHERGAFTGAHGTRIGRFEQANGGTLFLDEIGDMPTTLQTRLLRVLTDGQFYRIGGPLPLTVDVRIIAATHQNLEALVREGRFREDLFHRLNVIRIEAPPLRERREDIPALLARFLEESAAELGETPRRMTPAFARYASSLPWPGNVRQLRNTAHWLTVMASAVELKPEDLPDGVRDQPRTSELDWERPLRQWAESALAAGRDGVAREAIALCEKVLIRAAMQNTQERRQDAARQLGWSRNTLTRKIREYGMDDEFS
ncbi:MAG: nitrogen regulation protein NR(I) [Gammaproteobacteria bacterium]|nr:MAG: nitrogen regulation protein NR(I) [Gammaproteobacteria bacterium]